MVFRSTTNTKYSKYHTQRGGDLYMDEQREPGTATLIMIPWLIFLIGTVLFAFLYTIFPVLVWVVLLGCILAGLRWMVLGAWGGRIGTTTLGIACVIACVLSTFVGLYTNERFLEEYWRLERGNVYNNVLPSESAMAHDDAAVLIFTEGTIIDTSRASGYKAPGGIQCVAPILNAIDFDGRVEYWAVGNNCCHARGDFACDDALNPAARSGIVIGIYPGPPTTTPPATSLTVDHADATVLLSRREDLSPEWVPAIRAAEATFGMVAAERALLVRWSADPALQESNLWKAAIILLICSIVVHLLVSCVTGCLIGKAIRGRRY